MIGMQNRKLLFPTLVVIMLCTMLTFIISNKTQAYADNADAIVEQASTSNNNAPTSTTRKPPVSIATYSNVVTESADTYNYTSNSGENNTSANTNNSIDTNNNNIDNKEISASTNITSSNKEANSTITQTGSQNNVPQVTGTPDGETEPDIITYPPTIAPPYTD